MKVVLQRVTRARVVVGDEEVGAIERGVLILLGVLRGDDPNAADDFLDGILQLPTDRPAVLQVTSLDVIHNFHIVPMRIQQDAIPGREIPMWFTPTRPLETTVVCGQLCGENHGIMVGRLEVVEQEAYNTWFASRSEEALKANTAPTVALR